MDAVKVVEPCSPRPRADANHIAFGAIRSILEAASPLALSVEGTRIAVDVTRLAPGPWPHEGAVGLDEAADGPWPGVVRLDCRWEGGRSGLVMSAALGRGNGPTRHLVGIRIASAVNNRAIVWVTVPLALREGKNGERVWVGASFSVH